VGLLFIASANTAFSQSAAVLSSFPIEKLIVQKEQASNWYYLSAYYISKFVSEIPTNLLGPVIFATVLYWSVAFDHTVEKYFIWLGFVCEMALTAVGLGFMLSALAPNVEVATAMR
jgi:ABC-type multidrug transport system permease subunit